MVILEDFCWVFEGNQTSARLWRKSGPYKNHNFVDIALAARKLNYQGQNTVHLINLEKCTFFQID